MIDAKKKCIVFFVLISILSILPFKTLNRTQAIEQDTSLSIKIDQKIELIAIISSLDQIEDYFQCELLNTVIKRDAMEWFRPYQRHNAVLTYRKLIAQGQSSQSLRKFLLELGTLPDLTIPDLLSKEFQNDLYKQWQKDLVSFVSDSEFFTFYSLEEEFYNQIIEQYTIDKEIAQNIENLISFVGKKDWSIQIVLTPIILYDEQIIIVENKTQKLGYLILGLTDIENGRLIFGNKETTTNMIYSDLLPQIVKIILKSYYQDITKLDNLWNPIQEKMKEDKILTWNDCFEKHITLSIQIYYIEVNKLEAIDYWNDKGFIYLRTTFNLIKQYNMYREYFPSLDDFMPRIINQYNSFAKVGL